MPGQRWMILAVLFAARAATGFQFQSVGSTATMLMRDLAIDYSGIGMLLGAYLLPGVIVAFPTGVLGQRFRDKTLGLIGLLLMAVSAAVLGAAEGFAVALVGWAVVHLSSTGRPNGNDRRPTPTRLRRWLNALFDRMWKAAE